MPDLSDLRPRLSRRVAGSLADQAGGTAYGGAVEGSTDVAFGGPTADFILYGVVNGAFAQGPAHPEDIHRPAEQPDALLGRAVPVSGGAIQVSWVTDASSPSGHNLRFTLNPGAAGDKAYVETVVPVAGTRSQSQAERWRIKTMAKSGPATVASRSPRSTSIHGRGAGFCYAVSVVPGDPAHTQRAGCWSGDRPSAAYSMRLRVGIQRAGGSADDAITTVDFTEYLARQERTRRTRWRMPSPDDHSAAQIYQNSGILRFVADAVDDAHTLSGYRKGRGGLRVTGLVAVTGGPLIVRRQVVNWTAPSATASAPT